MLKKLPCPHLAPLLRQRKAFPVRLQSLFPHSARPSMGAAILTPLPYNAAATSASAGSHRPLSLSALAAIAGGRSGSGRALD